MAAVSQTGPTTVPVPTPGSAQVLEQLRQHQGVRRAVVRVAVVEEDVDLLRLARDLLDPGHPFLELALVVEVSEALDDRDPGSLPGLRSTAVEPDHGKVR